jgi:hypothetical protein
MSRNMSHCDRIRWWRTTVLLSALSRTYAALSRDCAALSRHDRLSRIDRLSRTAALRRMSPLL